MKIIDNLRNWLKPKPAPAPTPAPVPVPQPPTLAKYLQAWQLLKNIQVHRLLPAALSVSAVVFLAISGFIAWLVVVCAFVIRLFKIAL